MNVPNWWEMILLAAGAWRIFHLIALDDILTRPRRHVTDGNEKFSEFLTCVYCFGAYVSVLFWCGWLIWPHVTLVLSGLLTLATGVIVIQRLLDPN